MKKTKVFILLPDGVSLRNFAYTSFHDVAVHNGYELVFWHHTPFELDQLGFNELRLPEPKLHGLTTVLKNVRKRVELSQFAKRYQDPIYIRYRFPLSYKGIKNTIRSILTAVLTFILNSENGLIWVRKTINKLEERTDFHQRCKAILKVHQPDLIYCTSQRSVLAIAPLLAAKSMGIPSVCFIFSWDNVPKATLDVTTDYYHVWSNFMKEQLVGYHPFINEHQVMVTGTPQFEPHSKKDSLPNKIILYNTYGLNLEYNYFCFSGDDVTTSPQDPLYLRDVAKAIRHLNTQGHKLGLIFRRCPVDFSNRYDEVIVEYNDVIIPIEPIWKKLGTVWDTILPMPEDVTLLASLSAHTLGVFNLGSSMVFDFAIHDKPCFYMNYHYKDAEDGTVKGVHVYDYVHFRSKPVDEVVYWLDTPEMIPDAIELMLNGSSEVVHNAKHWFQRINNSPYQDASSRIVDSLSSLIQKS